MAGNASSIEEGLQYQELYGWYRVLELLSAANKVASVAIEDKEAKYFDDVTLRPWPNTSHPAEFLQVKFHVDLSDQYSSDSFMKESHGYLLKKAFATWQKLRAEHSVMELWLVSTWAWNPKDPLATHVRDQRLTEDFVSGNVKGNAANVRAAWCKHLGDPNEHDFQPFLRCIRLWPSYPATSQLLRVVEERMRYCGLTDTDEAAWKGAGRVRNWIIGKHPPITRKELEEAIEELDLKAAPAEPSVTLYVHTVVKDPTETVAEYELDWQHYFRGEGDLRGHDLYEPADWNGKLLPELAAMRMRIRADIAINQPVPVKLLRLRGSARLSPWLAVGYTFRETDGWVLEADQYGKHWRTDAEPSIGRAYSVETRTVSGDQDTVAIAIAVSGPLDADVTADLARKGNPAGRLVLVTSPEYGPTAIRSDADLVAMARCVKSALQSLQPRAKHLLVFYRGPASGAAFIGHQLNAVAGDIQLFEEKLGEYAASFSLS
jgi:hypothetical protein